MAHLTLLISLLTTATALSLPQNLARQSTNSTPVKYYQGGSTDNGCNIEVTTGSISANICNSITVYGLGIGQTSGINCTFALHQGSSTCDSGSSKVSNIIIPAGTGYSCITAGVEDGGKYQKASGVWSCP
jgi:hypothetical protein